jgi:DNA polymerase V
MCNLCSLTKGQAPIIALVRVARARRATSRQAVSANTTRAAEKMRRQHLATASLVVFVETNSFRPQDAQYHASKLVQLPVATADTGTLIAAAMRVVSAIWRSGYRYKKAGVMLLDLVQASRVQAGLFDVRTTPGRRRV